MPEPKADRKAKVEKMPAPPPDHTLTIKQENFCLFYIEEGNASDAYRRAYDAEGMKPNTVNRKAFDLLENGKVRARIEELRAARLKRHEVTVDRILAEYAKIGFADIRKAVEWRGHRIQEEDNPDGGDVLVIRNIYSNHVSLISSDAIDDDTAAAISEVSEGATGGVKVKFHDKRAALSDMGRYLGMFTDNLNLAGKGGGPLVVNIQRFTDAED